MTTTRSRRKPAAKKRPRQTTYASDLSPEIKWYLKTRGYKLPPHVKPLWRTPEPRHVRGAYFDPALVDQKIDALSRMRHTQGKWAGHPLRPDPWQVAFIIAPIFGWVRDNADGRPLRIIRDAWIEVPRKNGKTTISAGLALLLAFADKEPGAQVIAAAGSRDQAMNAFRPAYLIAQKSKDLKKAGVQAWKKEIVRTADQSFMMAVGSIGDLLQGSNPNGFIADEMHVHKSSDVLDALESGTGARDQPLGIKITTADAGGLHTVYARERKRVEQLCRGAVKNPSEYGVVFGAPSDADPFKVATWKRANPGYPISPTPEFMKTEAAKARSSPANLARFLRLNLNRRTKQETKYIELDAWDRNAGMVDELALAGRECFGGLDLASVSDLSALAWLFPRGDGDPALDVLFRFWTPEDNVAELDKRTNGAASEWVEQGWLTTTPGNVQDYDHIRTQIGKDAEAFNVRSIGFDPYNSTGLTNDLLGDGLNLVKVRQGFLTISPPTKELQRLVLKGTARNPMLVHGGNPVARWCIDNLAVEFDAAGNVKPSKKRSGDKIDAVSALVTALSEYTQAEIEASPYENHDLIIA